MCISGPLVGSDAHSAPMADVCWPECHGQSILKCRHHSAKRQGEGEGRPRAGTRSRDVDVLPASPARLPNLTCLQIACGPLSSISAPPLPPPRRPRPRSSAISASILGQSAQIIRCNFENANEQRGWADRGANVDRLKRALSLLASAPPSLSRNAGIAFVPEECSPFLCSVLWVLITPPPQKTLFHRGRW